MTGDGSIGDYQGGGGDASFGDAHSSSVAADLGFDIGTRGTSTAPDSIDVEQGQTLQGALAQALFDRLSQIDYTTPAGMAQGRFGLDSMSNLGLGRTEGLNPNNPTQSVDEMINAQNFGTVLGYVAPAIASMAPGYGAVSALGKGIANIHGLIEGRLTPAEVMPGLAAGLISAKTGIPSGILEGLFENNPGKAAGAGAQAGLTSLANSMSPFGGLAVNLSGLGSAVNRGVSDAVGGSRGGAPSSSSSGLTGLLGGSSAPSQGSAPTGNASGDVGISPDTYAVLAAIEQAAQEPAQPAWERQTVAGRYGPIMNYEFGA